MISENLKGRYQTFDNESARNNDKDAARLIDSITEGGYEDDRPLVRIPEAEFVNAWLPLFTGEFNVHGFNRQHYINRIGGSYREAYVVDVAGNELFKIPPINDREANTPVKLKSTKHEISQSLSDFDREKQARPRVAFDDLRSILMQHAEVMQSRKQADKYLDEWNAIFKRYNKSLVDLKRSSSSNQPQDQGTDEQFNTYQDI